MNTDQQADIQQHTVAALRKDDRPLQKVSDRSHNTVLTVENLETRRRRGQRGDLQSRRLLPADQGYFYWDKHCFDIPVCWRDAGRLFDTLDGSTLSPKRSTRP